VQVISIDLFLDASARSVIKSCSFSFTISIGKEKLDFVFLYRPQQFKQVFVRPDGISFDFTKRVRGFTSPHFLQILVSILNTPPSFSRLSIDCKSELIIEGLKGGLSRPVITE
jgi:hypothetical protein